MSKKFPKKIQQAIARGELVPHEKVFRAYSPRKRGEILAKAHYFKAAMELRRLRRQLRLSQDELAKKMAVKREFISQIESGRQNVTLETLYRIADAAGKELHLTFR
jgi:DNA-binding XRE family transcriptional regulator